MDVLKLRAQFQTAHKKKAHNIIWTNIFRMNAIFYVRKKKVVGRDRTDGSKF